MRLEDKVAIITGSTKGIGLGIARAFVREGAKVVITSRNEEDCKKVAFELGSEDNKAIYVRTDVKNSDNIKNMINKTIDAFGKLDILVNNAGYNIPKDAEGITEEEWEFIQHTNLRSTFLCCKYALPYLKKTKGNIINISSMAGIQGFFKSAAYSPTKAGQIALAKNIAIDYGKDGIRANTICPGYIRTPLSDVWFESLNDNGTLMKQILEKHLVGRFGNLDDCGYAAVYLASDEASFLTGITLNVDGGVTLGY
ncbi:MAG: SDR family oxidoreductase [Eubacteriales bacterium]|nr:SDR family oxidoreductase [Eubacteriales bacterium]